MTVLPWATNDVTSAVAEEGCVHYITDYGLKKACMKLAVSLSCNSSHKITVIKFIILFVCLCFKLQPSPPTAKVYSGFCFSSLFSTRL